MGVYNNVFISYGRKHSKDFATKLHNDLVSNGFDVWFDQNDIPLGVDFQAQIDDGILKSDNFCFIISPHSVRSEYCGKEIQLAKKLKKRIIPILHVEPKDDWDKMDELIAKLNWIYFREDLDDYQKSFGGFTELLRSDLDYLRTHTDILTKASAWITANKNGSHLLVGAERTKAETWLLTRFLTKQAPTSPTQLHAEFITESKKNANNLQTDVFISYDRDDNRARDLVKQRLALENITCWTDTEDIKTGKAFEEAIREGIEQADNFVYLISPASVVSKFCLLEIDIAIELRKRVIPIMLMPVPDKDLPPSLANIQYIDFSDNTSDDDLHEDFNRLLGLLEENHDYYHKAKVFLVKALKWQRQNKNQSVLLRGYNLEGAQTWLKLGKQRKIHPPLPIHTEYIEESAKQTADLTTEIFISYSRKDSDFSRKLNERLQISGKTTWFDQESIAAGSDFASEINKGIETSDNFVFIISPASIESPYCNDEVEHAHKFGKRIITVLYQDINLELLHPVLAAVQWIDFRVIGAKFDVAFSELVRTIDTDREHVQSHTKWQHAAIEWHNKKKNNDLLLRGSAFSVADLWLETAIAEHKKPAPTPEHKEFIEASRKAIFADARRQKRSLFILRILLLFSVIGLFVAVYSTVKAYKSEQIATEQAIIAEKNAKNADLQKEQALLEKKRADDEKIIADEARKHAELQKIEADSAKMNAIEAKKEAVKNANKAKENADKAAISEQKAKSALIDAEKAKQEEEKANRLARFHLYKFNGKEMAYNSLNEEQDKQLCAQLALTGYELTDYSKTEFSDINTVQTPFPAIILEALQRALLLYENNELKKSSILALRGGVKTFLFADERNRLSWCSMDNERKNLKLIHEYQVNAPMIRAIGVDVPHQFGAIGTTNGKVFLSDSSFMFKETYHHEKEVLNLLFLPEKNLLLSAGLDSKTIVYNTQTHKIEFKIQTQNPIRTIVNLQGNRLLLADIEGQIYSTSLDKPTELTPFDTQGYLIYSLNYFEKMNWLTAGTQDGKVVVFDLNNKDKATLLTRGHKGAITSIAFSRDGKKLASASLDGSVLLWHLEENSDLTKLVPITIQYPDALVGTRKIFSIDFYGNDYLLLGDNNSLRLSSIHVETVYNKLKKKVNAPKLPNELWNYYIQGDLERPSTK